MGRFLILPLRVLAKLFESLFIRQPRQVPQPSKALRKRQGNIISPSKLNGIQNYSQRESSYSPVMYPSRRYKHPSKAFTLESRSKLLHSPDLNPIPHERTRRRLDLLTDTIHQPQVQRDEY